MASAPGLNPGRYRLTWRSRRAAGDNGGTSAMASAPAPSMTSAMASAAQAPPGTTRTLSGAWVDGRRRRGGGGRAHGGAQLEWFATVHLGVGRVGPWFTPCAC